MVIRNFKVSRPIYTLQTYFWKIKNSWQHMKTVVEPLIIFSFQSISKIQTNIITEKKLCNVQNKWKELITLLKKLNVLRVFESLFSTIFSWVSISLVCISCASFWQFWHWVTWVSYSKFPSLGTIVNGLSSF